MNKYKVIAFDIDDTLVDDGAARKYAISKVTESLGISYTDELGNAFIQFDSQYWHDWESGKIPIPNDIEDWVTYVRSMRFYKFFSDTGIDYDTAVSIYHLYTDAIENCIVPFDGARETLEKLKEKYKLVIATNGIKKLIFKKLEIIQVKDLFSIIVCAEEVGYNKPHKLFFEQLIKECPCNKNEILLVGDSLTSDVLGGMNNSIDTCWFNPNHDHLPKEYKPTYEIDTLYQLTEIL